MQVQHNKGGLFRSNVGHIQLCRIINKLISAVAAKEIVVKEPFSLQLWDPYGIHENESNSSLLWWDTTLNNLYKNMLQEGVITSILMSVWKGQGKPIHIIKYNTYKNTCQP